MSIVKLSYKPEIDGLRAIAVLSVILYHAEFVVGGANLLPGGFLGVDVFFVISGFLITSLLVNEFHQRSAISIANFYERRARRLLPVLLIVILTSLPFAWMYLLPEQLLDFSKSLLSSIAFSSNFYWYYSLQEYGAESALLKPFLHTWSLAVEEQYYIVYPAILLVIYKWFKNYATLLLAIGLFSSLLFSEWMTVKDASFSFYLLPSRFWELLAGGFLAHALSLYPLKSQNSILNRVMPIFGLSLIIFSFVFLGKARHPGLYTLIPVLGTVLIIWFANDKEVVTKLLSSRVFVSVGVISYSLYLWHYPVLAFGRIIYPSASELDKASWVFVTFLLSIASYFIVETPFRNRSIVSFRVFFGIVLTLLIVVSAVSGYFYKTEGAAFRLDHVAAYSEFSEPEYNRLKSEVDGKKFNRLLEFNECNGRDPYEACVFGDGKFVTLGDSFTAHYETALLRIAESYQHGLIGFSQSGCPLANDNFWFGAYELQCPEANRKRRELIEKYETTKIIFVSANSYMFEEPKGVKGFDPTRDDAIKSYLDNISHLLELGHYVVLLSDPPGASEPIFQEWKNSLLNSFIRTSESIYHPDKELYNRNKVRELDIFSIDHENLIKVSLPDVLCPEDQGRQCLVISTHGSIYHDNVHLSFVGANLVLEHVFSRIDEKGWLKEIQ